MKEKVVKKENQFQVQLIPLQNIPSPCGVRCGGANLCITRDPRGMNFC